MRLTWRRERSCIHKLRESQRLYKSSYRTVILWVVKVLNFLIIILLGTYRIIMILSSSPAASEAAWCDAYGLSYMGCRGYSNCVPI